MSLLGETGIKKKLKEEKIGLRIDTHKTNIKGRIAVTEVRGEIIGID